MPQCGLRMNNVSFLKQWGKKYGIGIIVGLLMSVGFLVMDADRWISVHTLNQKTAKYTVVIDSGHGITYHRGLQNVIKGLALMVYTKRISIWQ